ncbi:MAG: hypothetical protein ACOVNL_04355 [Prochlorococcaceae cyanobacterium]
MARRRRDKEQEKTSRLAIQAAANLQLVGAEPEVVEQVVSEILDRRLTDDSSGGTADTLVGRAVIETITGKPAPAFLPRAGEVGRALIDAQANLQLAGIDETDEARAVTDRIVQEGLRGARAQAAVREVVAPVVAQVEAAQQGSTEPAAPAQTAADTGRAVKAPALQDLPAAQPPAASGATPQGSEAPTPAPAPAPATTPAAGATPAPGPGVDNTPAATPPRTGPAPEEPGASGGGQSDPVPGVVTPEAQNTITAEINQDGNLTYVERDPSGAVVSVTTFIPFGDGRENVVVTDGEGNVMDAYVQNGPGETVVTAKRGGDGSGQQGADQGGGEGNGNNGEEANANDEEDDGDEDGDNDDGDSGTSDGDDSQSQNGGDGAEANDASGDQPAASGTPNPEAETGGSGLELHEATGGRLGGDTARRQQDRLDQFSKDGGAAGPEAGEDKASGVLLTPEEQANAARLLGVKAGGGITTPSPLEEGGTAITERDLKDLVLRGNGGAGTPDVVMFPLIQPPQSPLAPPAGVPGVGGDPITGLGTISAIPSLSSVQRFGAIPLAEMPGGKSIAETSAAAAPLATGTAGFSPVAPEIFGSQVSGFAGVEIQLRGLAAFQAAPLLA